MFEGPHSPLSDIIGCLIFGSALACFIGGAFGSAAVAGAILSIPAALFSLFLS